MLGEQLFAQYPVRIVELTLIHLIRIAVFDDRPHLDIGKSESLGKILHTFRFHDLLLEYLAVEVDDRTVRTDRSRLQTLDALASFYEGNLDVRVLAAFFLQHLDSVVDYFL